ncbi:MAG TPA: PASTA domain-containing protein, partial [Thermoanaerobaculia bacterium]|nr:PASTA domain-containing protein [Thermoanaerobaculia bacterium]
VVMRALAKDPEARFKDADAFLKALDAAEKAPDTPRPQDTAAYAAVSPEGEADIPGDEEEDYDEYDQDGRHRWRWLVIALLACAVAALVAYALTRPTHSAIPDVIGKTSDQASQILDDKGFKVAIKAVPSGAPRDQVVEQDPIPTDRGGGKAEEGSTVTLSVSSGPAIAAVPSVVGLDEAEATKRLENVGFKVNAMQQFSKTVPRGAVIGTSPPAGTQLSTLQPVTLLVSRGANTVLVPNVVGLNDQAALAALSNAGLSGTEVQKDSTEPAGKVLSQSPGSGKRVGRGSQVTIFASTGAITVPDVTGQPRKEAVNALKKAGFTAAVTEQTTTDPTEVGVVLSEFPPSGSRGQRGDTVTIAVGVSAPVVTTP